MKIDNIQFAKIAKIGFGCRAVSEYNSGSLGILAEFLAFEIGNDDMPFGFFLNWLWGKYKQKEAEGNAYGLMEYKDKILVYLQPHICGKKPYGKNASITFSTSRDQMINIMGDWAYVMSQAQEPNAILITQEGENVKFTIQD